MASDASTPGFATIRVSCGNGIEHEWHEGDCGKKLSARLFSPSEAAKSSVFRELTAICELYLKYKAAFAGRAVVHFTDSLAVTIIMAKGSGKSELQNMALSIYKVCRQQSITLQVLWRRRSDPHIQLANEWSRAFDWESWGLVEEAFLWISAFFPRFQFDLFASEENNRCALFAASIFSQSCAARNAFTMDWSILGFCWTCPPIRLIGAALRHATACESQGVLLCPLWRTMHCWKLLCYDGVHFNRLFSSVFSFFPELRSGPFVTNAVFSGVTSFPMLLLGYDGRVSDPFASVITKSHCIYNGCYRCCEI
jgi:hypothetical protein